MGNTHTQACCRAPGVRIQGLDLILVCASAKMRTTDVATLASALELGSTTLGGVGQTINMKLGLLVG